MEGGAPRGQALAHVRGLLGNVGLGALGDRHQPRIVEVRGPIDDPEDLHHLPVLGPLGVLGDVACYAASLGDGTATPGGMAFEEVRPLLFRLDEELAAVAGLAVQIVEWDRTHLYCGACGKRRAAPRAPNPKLNGSFQKPKPNVPGG